MRIGCLEQLNWTRPGSSQQMFVTFPIQGYACAQKQLHFMDQLLDAVQSLDIRCSTCSR